jgi:GNAT superfamily N-acetyltransferase
MAVFAGTGSPVNKVIGVGFAGAPDGARFEAIEALFAARQAPVQVEIATLADPQWHAALALRGYALAGFENVLGLALTDVDVEPAWRPAPGARATVAVVECSPHDDGVWLDTIATGFQYPDNVPAQATGQHVPRDVIERIFGELASVPGFRRYLAYVDGVVVGGASLREFEGVAQLCGAATLPRFRRQGVQSALLDARLRDARGRGCDIAVVTTAPGSKSQHNTQRRGFTLLYARALHVKSA